MLWRCLCVLTSMLTSFWTKDFIRIQKDPETKDCSKCEDMYEWDFSHCPNKRKWVILLPTSQKPFSSDLKYLTIQQLSRTVGEEEDSYPYGGYSNNQISHGRHWDREGTVWTEHFIHQPTVEIKLNLHIMAWALTLTFMESPKPLSAPLWAYTTLHYTQRWK